MKGTKATDSLQMKVDKSVGDLEEKVNLNNKLDTLKNIEFGDKVIQKIDSIQDVPEDKLSKIEEKINKPQQFIDQKADSVTSLLNRPSEVVNKKIDETINKANNRIDSLQNKVMNTVDETENKIQTQVNKITDGEVAVPGLDKSKIPGVGLDDVSIGEGTVKGVGLGDDIKVDVPELNAESLNIDVPEIKELDVNKSIDIPDASKIKELGEVKEVENVKQQVTGELDNTDAQLAELEKYESELRKVKEGDMKDLDKRAENELMRIDEVKGLTGEARKASELRAQHEAMIQKPRQEIVAGRDQTQAGECSDRKSQSSESAGKRSAKEYCYSKKEI